MVTEGRGNPQVSYLGTSIDAMIYDFMAEKNIPGLVLAIVQAPYIPRVVGYGLSDIKQKRLASTKTLWAIGPISQGYTAVAIIQLYEQGKLSIHDNLSKYLQGIPENWNNITILQLLQHASGIADYRFQNGYNSLKPYKTDELIGLVENTPLRFNPGTDVFFSATNFLLLAEVIEKTAQMSHQEFIKKNQFEKLELKHTCFFEDLGKLKQEKLTENSPKHKEFLKNHQFIDPIENATGCDLNLQPIQYTSLKGFADIWASSEDISFWDIALAGSILIEKAENRALIYSSTTLSSGKTVPAVAGWQFFHHKGLMDIKGTHSGFSSFLSRFTDPSELVCVTLLANKEGVDFTNLGRRIASAFGKELSSGYNDDELFLYESVFDVSQTMDRIEKELKTHNIPIFAKFDHGKNAKEVNLDLKPTQVIVFGSPAVGTKLMQENPSISIDLPLKIAVWEDSKGSAWVAFPRMDKLAKKYSSLDNKIVQNMQGLLEKLVKNSASIY